MGEVITLMKKLNAKCSTSALLMVLEVLPSTASSAPMEPSSIRTTSSVTGGSMLIVPSLLLLPRPRTLRLLLLERLPLLPLHLMLLIHALLQKLLMNLLHLMMLQPMITTMLQLRLRWLVDTSLLNMKMKNMMIVKLLTEAFQATMEDSTMFRDELLISFSKFFSLPKYFFTSNP